MMVIRHDKSANLQQYICLTLHEVHFILLTLVPRNCTYPFGADRQISFYCPLLVCTAPWAGGRRRPWQAAEKNVRWRVDYASSQLVGLGFESHWRLTTGCPRLADTALKTWNLSPFYCLSLTTRLTINPL